MDREMRRTTAHLKKENPGGKVVIGLRDLMEQQKIANELSLHQVRCRLVEFCVLTLFRWVLTCPSLCLRPHLSKPSRVFLGPGQYLLGDAAYTHIKYTVPPYKAPEANQNENQKFKISTRNPLIEILDPARTNGLSLLPIAPDHPVVALYQSNQKELQ